MQASNANQNFSSGDPEWVLLAELSLGDFLPDHDRREGPVAGFLFQITRELGMSPEYVENIARTLAGFAIEALARTKQERLEVPGRIRIFCQKKIMGDANAEKPSRLSEQDKQQKQILPDSRASRIGGWGYFSIERAGNSVDLYLYKEGE